MRNRQKAFEQWFDYCLLGVVCILTASWGNGMSLHMKCVRARVGSHGSFTHSSKNHGSFKARHVAFPVLKSPLLEGAGGLAEGLENWSEHNVSDHCATKKTCMTSPN